MSLKIQTKRASNEDRLDATLHALSHRTRRALLKRLAAGPAMVGELAKPIAMSRVAVSKHLRVLENARLISRTVDGRVHRCARATRAAEGGGTMAHGLPGLLDGAARGAGSFWRKIKDLMNEPPNDSLPSKSPATLVVRRRINATAEKLFAAWTRPELLVRWWGPQGVACPAAEIDLRVGGSYRIANQFPDGTLVWIAGVFEADRAASPTDVHLELGVPKRQRGAGNGLLRRLTARRPKWWSPMNEFRARRRGRATNAAGPVASTA